MVRTLGWIIYPKYVASHDDNAFQWLVVEAEALGLTLKVLFIEDITIGCSGGGTFLTYQGRKIDHMPRFVLIRTYNTVISKFFENAGIPVINSAASMELCKNKMLTHAILSRAGISTPPTVYNESAHYDYYQLCELFGATEFIVKLIDGAKGENVYLAGSEREMLEAIEKCGGRCICQKFIEESYGKDVRVWVIGDRVAGAVMRYSDTSFLSNFSQGGKVAAFALPDEAAETAVRSAALIGAEFTGIDLLFSSDGFMVNEINGNAGFRTLSKIGANNIPHRLFKYIKDKYCNEMV